MGYNKMKLAIIPRKKGAKNKAILLKYLTCTLVDFPTRPWQTVVRFHSLIGLLGKNRGKKGLPREYVFDAMLSETPNTNLKCGDYVETFLNRTSSSSSKSERTQSKPNLLHFPHSIHQNMRWLVRLQGLPLCGHHSPYTGSGM